jgi:AcrR family transcriptional regulator
MEQAPQEKLVTAATGLFLEHGFHGVGINRILAEAGVAKKTMYRHFPSKEDLIVAVLKAYSVATLSRFRKGVEAHGDNPEDGLMAFFDVARAWFAEDRFFGCLFVSAASEYSSEPAAIRAACQAHKNAVRSQMQDLCFQAGLADPFELGDKLFLLLEGATAMAHVSGDPSGAVLAKSSAGVLVANSRIDT